MFHFLGIIFKIQSTKIFQCLFNLQFYSKTYIAFGSIFLLEVFLRESPIKCFFKKHYK